MRSLRRPVLRLRVAHRFGVVLAGLLIVMAVVAAVATIGVRRVNDRAIEIDHELSTTDMVSSLALRLADTEQALLRVISANSPERRGELEAGLDANGLRVASLIAELRAAVASDSRAERAAVDDIETQWRAFLELRRRAEFDATDYGPEAAARDEKLADDVSHVFAPARALTEKVLDNEVADAAKSRKAAQHTYRFTRFSLFGLVGGAVLVAAGLLSWLIRSVVPRVRAYARYAVDVAEGRLSERLEVEGSDELADLGHALDTMVRDQLRARDHDQAQSAFSHALQTAENEGDAHELIRRHLQRSIAGVSVVVLNRNNSADRLQAMTDVPEGSPLQHSLAGAAPRSCLAVRFGQAQDQGAGCDPLVSCELCQTTEGASLCEPLLVGGEVIGSIVIERLTPIDADARRTIRQSVTQAAPVLALSEFRANNDALTGLPNRRATEETTKRMVALASRTATPLALGMLDLDHFKQINDTYGHDVGDDALAAAAVAIRHRLRETDFVGRYGGEEFVVLLPDTDRDGARSLFEAVREAVGKAIVNGVDRPITVSVGVAVIPDDADDSSTLLRIADRLLYSAKANGRNQVALQERHPESVVPSVTPVVGHAREAAAR
ncbi:MAG: diguanylate cyclase [Actinobacteria bacterium]|nr:MAG: diguanylate cyclase [Actinomycetota bacterium]